MIQIDRDKRYVVGDFEYINYIHLSFEEKRYVLQLRNREIVRQWMYNTKEIDEASHLSFIDSLSQKNNTYYWAIKRNGNIEGCYNLANIDFFSRTCESGLFFTDTSLTGLKKIWELELNTIEFTFDILGFHQITGYTHSDNSFMLRVNRTMGFKVSDIECGYYICQVMTDEYFNSKIKGKSTFRDFLRNIR